jgi:hypothetical protein
LRGGLGAHSFADLLGDNLTPDHFNVRLDHF